MKQIGALDKALFQMYRSMFPEFNDENAPISHTGKRSTIPPDSNIFTQSVRRKTSRQPSGVKFTLSQIHELLITVAGRNLNREHGTFKIPMAGGINDLRLIICRTSSNSRPQEIYEFSPEDNDLKEVYRRSDHEFWFEDWELNAIFNVVFCAPKSSRRSYTNNLMHLCFESGAIVQNIYTATASLGINICISGIVNVPRFLEVVGEGLTPLHSVSIL